MQSLISPHWTPLEVRFGFGSSASFARWFRKEFRSSASAWRARRRR